MNVQVFVLLACVIGAVFGEAPKGLAPQNCDDCQKLPYRAFPLPSKVVRPAGRCVPAPEPAVCLDMPVKIGSTFRQTCERLNDPRKDDVMTGMPERCINAIERDGAACLQAALDLACSFHCGRCDSPWMAKGFVPPLCPDICNMVIMNCPTANNELNCFKHFDLRSNCATINTGCASIRGDLTKIISASATLASSFVVMAASLVAAVSFMFLA